MGAAAVCLGVVLSDPSDNEVKVHNSSALHRPLLLQAGVADEWLWEAQQAICSYEVDVDQIDELSRAERGGGCQRSYWNHRIADRYSFPHMSCMHITQTLCHTHMTQTLCQIKISIECVECLHCNCTQNISLNPPHRF